MAPAVRRAGAAMVPRRPEGCDDGNLVDGDGQCSLQQSMAVCDRHSPINDGRIGMVYSAD